MEPAEGWAGRADAWLDRDHQLLTEDEGWHATLARNDLQVWRRPMPDDPNHLFRWRLPVVAAAADVVFEGFVHRVLDYHKEWTREFVGGHVVETIAPGRRVLYQRFAPGVPGIARRDLCSAEAVRTLASGARLASFRSVDTVPVATGHERIDWWGAALCTALPGGDACELVYLDRENQGGRFPAWLMNRLMTKYLVVQAEQVRRFFASGGPPELRAGPSMAPP